MSRTDNTAPWWIQKTWRHDGAWGGCKPNASRWLRKYYNRVARARARTALRRGIEPAPEQHRHRALWEGW